MSERKICIRGGRGKRGKKTFVKKQGKYIGITERKPPENKTRKRER